MVSHMVNDWKVKSLDISLRDETIIITQRNCSVQLDKAELIGIYVVLQKIITILKSKETHNSDNGENVI